MAMRMYERSTKKKKQRPPPKVTAAWLERACMHYLSRFVASRRHLRTVLMRKVEKSARFHGEDAAQHTDLIDGLVDKMEAAGLVDDKALARGLVQSLHRRGKSRRFIQQKLKLKGIEDDDAQQALTALAESAHDAELLAAVQLVKKKRLGPLRDDEVRRDHLQKDLARLARAGFAYGVARRVLDVEDEDALLQLEDMAAGDEL